jgi:uncharacterized protein (TIGR03435 family)
VFLIAIAIRAIYGYYHYYPWQVQPPDIAILDSNPPQVVIVPARYSSGGGLIESNGRMLGIGQSIDTLLEITYNTSKARMTFSTELPKDKYDFIANLPKDNQQALRQEFDNIFNLTTKKDKRELDVLLLTIKHINTAGLRSSAASRSPGSPAFSQWYGNNYYCANVPFSTFITFLEQRLNIPVVDQTRLSGKYDIDLSYRRSYPETLKQAVVRDLGLEFHPGHKQIEILVVEKAH